MNLAAAPARTAPLRVDVFENDAALCRHAAEQFIQTVHAAVAARGYATVALSGGSTPKGLYALLATEPYRARVPWDRLHVFWGDERSVPPDSPQSNYRMACEALLAHVPVAADHVHRMCGEMADLDAAARDYEQTIRSVFAQPEGVVIFDLVHLGIGEDGHTASLFPHTRALGEAERLVVPNRVDALDTDRLTVTYPVLNAAANVVFLVTGPAKAEVLRAVLEGPYVPLEHPSEGVQPGSGTLTWLVDEAAAARLSPSTRSAGGAAE